MLALIAVSAMSEPPAGLPPKEERLYGVSQVWKQASDFYTMWDLTDEDLDWDQAYETAFQEAARAKTARDYYLTLKKFLAHLHDGHADGLNAPGFMASRAGLPFVMDYMDQKFIVVQSEDTSQCPLGAVVETIDGMDTGEYLERDWGPYVGIQTPGVREKNLGTFLWDAGKEGQSLRLGLALADGSQKEAKVKWKKVRKGFSRMAYIKYGRALYSSDAFDVSMTEDNLALVEFKTQRDLAYIDEYFDRVVPLIADCRGVVLDVRKNGGGNSMVGKAILESFLGETIPYRGSGPETIKISSVAANYKFWAAYTDMGKETNLNGKAKETLEKSLGKLYDANEELYDQSIKIGEDMYRGRFQLTGDQMDRIYPILLEGREFTGEDDTPMFYQDRIPGNPMIGKPVVMVIGYGSGSATDTMAAMAKAEGVTIVGTRTRGATGNVIRIPAGDGWTAGISTEYALTPEGTPINNFGVEATVQVEQDMEDLRKGKDTQLEKAMEILH